MDGKNFYKKCLGFDSGRSDVKEAMFNKEGELVLRKYPSIAAPAPMNANDVPLMDGVRYYVGELALYAKPEEIIQTSDSSKIKLTLPLFLEKTLKENNLDPEELEAIVTGLSLAELTEAKEFQKRLTRFKISGKSYNFKDRIYITPQGVGAKYAIEYYHKDAPKAYIIVDIGFSTIDVVLVINGEVRLEFVKGFKDEGIIKMIRPLQDYIYKNFKEHIEIREAQSILDSGKYFIDGEDHDLSDYIKDLAKDYASYTIDTLRHRFKSEFKKYQKIYFVGGGAKWIEKAGELPSLAQVVENSEYYNAIGNLLKACVIVEEKKEV